MLGGTALAAGSLSWFAALGFAPNGDVPVATAVCFLAGLVWWPSRREAQWPPR